jgi:hypothetical protein
VRAAKRAGRVQPKVDAGSGGIVGAEALVRDVDWVVALLTAG